MSGTQFRGTVLVVGTGLIGTSIALALSATGSRVLLDDVDHDAVAVAVARGAGDHVRADDDPDVVVVAVPPAAIGSVLARMSQQYPRATLTDVSSVKAAPLAAALAAGADERRLVGGHPMAGREVSGPGAARADLVADRLWALTPGPRSDRERVAQLEALVRTCGAVPVVLEPEGHDRAVALTSHTPQVLSSLLGARLAAADPADVTISGQGLRDISRLAASDPALWTEILGANAAHVAEVLAGVGDDLTAVVAALRELAGGPAAPAATGVVTDVLARGNVGRARVPDKHGGATSPRYATVAVVVEDRPGELGRLFAAAGGAGVNLEDVRIEHAPARRAAVVELDVVPGAETALAGALTGAGWSLRG